MSLLGVDRGTVASITGGSTTATISPNANFAASSWAVLPVADTWNNGPDPFVGIADSLGNTWTSRIFEDRASTALTARIRVFTTAQDVAPLQTSTVITLTYSQPLQRRALALKEAQRIPSSGSVVYRAGATSEGNASITLPSITTGAVAIGDLVIGIAAVLNDGLNSVWSPDSDTLGGAWSTAQIVVVHASDLIAQHKAPGVTTPQVFDPTFSFAFNNYVIGYVQLGYAPSTEVIARDSVRITRARASARLPSTRFGIEIDVSDD